jgi:tRNA threonylcarbamoyladenosine biosynthesis protein TsaE
MSRMSCTHPREFGPLDLAGIERLAEAMHHHLPPYLVIGLVGTLGAGKTTLVQAIARASGIDTADVTSPTFTLLQTHRGARTLHHLDAYRVADEDEFLELGVEELFDDESAWTLIEWADRIRSVLPQQTLWIEIIPIDQDRRLIRMTTKHPPIAQALDQIDGEV